MAVTASDDGTAMLWALPVPAQGEIQKVGLWAQVITGMELDESGAIHVLDAKAWQDRCRRFEEIAHCELRGYHRLVTATEGLVTPDGKKIAALASLKKRVEQIAIADSDQRRQTLAAVEAHLTENAGQRFSLTDLVLMAAAARALEDSGSHELAAAAYRDFGRLLAASRDKTLVDLANEFTGYAQRLALVGKEIDLKGTKVDGTPLDWASYRGKVVLVQFWTCNPTCRPELANVTRTYAVCRDRGFDVVGINLDAKRQELEEFVKQKPFPWVTLHTEGRGLADPIAVQCEVLAAPASLLVGKDGKVVSTSTRGERLNRLLVRLLGPLYVPKGKLTFLDLQPKGNQRLDEDFVSQGNDLKDLPRGEQTFAGVKFRIGASAIVLGSTNLPEMPLKVEAVQVNRRVARLFFLHATQWGAAQDVVDGKLIGQYNLHCEDGTEQSVPIVFGEDMRDWWDEDQRPITRGQVAWTGTNEAARGRNAKTRLYVSMWENPLPDKKVVSIDFVSANTASAPFCVAMTVDEPVAAKGDQALPTPAPKR